MSTTAQSLIQRTRRALNDWPDADALTASVSSSSTTIAVSGSFYTAGDLLELDSEAMLVRSVAGLNLTVKRGVYGTTAATHALGATVLYEPLLLSDQITDALADAVSAAFPYVYKPVIDETLTALDSVYEYTVPNMPGTSRPIPFIYQIETQFTGELTPWRFRNYKIMRGLTPKIKFRWALPAGTKIRVEGVGPFPQLTSSGSLDDQWPDELNYPLVEYATSVLLQSVASARAAAGESQAQVQTLSQTTAQTGTVVTANEQSTTTDNEQDVSQDTNMVFDTSTQDQDGLTTTSEQQDQSSNQTVTNNLNESVTGSPTQTQTMRTVQIAQEVADRALARFLRRVANSGYPPMPRRIQRVYC